MLVSLIKFLGGGMFRAQPVTKHTKNIRSVEVCMDHESECVCGQGRGMEQLIRLLWGLF